MLPWQRRGSMIDGGTIRGIGELLCDLLNGVKRKAGHVQALLSICMGYDA
jgi:hypothetical protein